MTRAVTGRASCGGCLHEIGPARELRVIGEPMRIGAFLFVGLGLSLSLVAAAACTSTATKDEDCIVQGGVCFTNLDPQGCINPIEAACSTGYTCCGTAYGANIVDGAVIDAPTGAPVGVDGGGFDAGTDAGASHDAASDAPASDASQKDGGKTDGALRDGAVG